MQATYDMVADISGITADVGFTKTVADPGTAVSAAGSIAAIAVAGAINIGVQIAGEEFKGYAQKELDMAAADFDKELALADLSRTFSRRVRRPGTLIAKDSPKCSRHRTTRLFATRRWSGWTASSAKCSRCGFCATKATPVWRAGTYADPIHFLRAQNSMIRADFAFRSAQRWVFLALRALEYKYNQPFVYAEPIPGSPRWELGSLFKLRNTDELGDLLNAMDQFNLANLGKLNGRSAVTERISLKNDVWGRTFTGSVGPAGRVPKTAGPELRSTARCLCAPIEHAASVGGARKRQPL